ncbi:class I SAM-dependent methyltransferase [Qipengyuania aurantiaca]|uniref:Class I SAM-dependent methyltransferase n=1 Tax=Qipengyuania aurantiaca TaxID=2867233 RepID=A0ABX8ZKF6_9SPHN|nr:class I SAM-dependent methyltransferase [Qipengyuania aurantiaca]
MAHSYERALDIGCGAGEITLELAQANAAASHLGIDISPELLVVARERTTGLANTAFELCDASGWTSDTGRKPDLLVSRHGVMFFGDPAKAFDHLRSQSEPDARMVFSCFRTPAENGWIRELAAIVPPGGEAPDPRAPGPFAFGEANYVRDVLNEGGWQSVELTPVDYAMIVGTGEDPVADAVSYFQAIGPSARALAETEGEEREAMLARLADMAAANRDGDTVSLAAACWIVTASAG